MFERTEPLTSRMPVAFRERRGPMNLLIVALAGFVVGVLATTTHDFTDPRVLSNGLIRLAIAAFLIGMLFWSENALEGGLRRQIQLGVLVSLLLHVGLAFYLYDRHLAALAERQQQLAIPTADERDRHSVAIFHDHWTADRPAAVQAEFEKPVPIQVPERQLPVISPSRPNMPPVVRKPDAFPRATPRPTPPRTEIRRVAFLEPPREEPARSQPIRRQPFETRFELDARIPPPALLPVHLQTVKLQSTDASVHRQAEIIQIAAVDGFQEMASDRAPLVSIPNRRLRTEAELQVVHAIPQPLVLHRSGGRWTLEGKTLEPPAAAFQQRQPDVRSQLAKNYGGSDATERAVERGLAFLVRHQFPDGRWCLDRLPDAQAALQDTFWAGEMNCDTAATGLSLLALLGAGYTHQQGEHRDAVGRGLQWLVGNQQPNGQLFTRETDTTQPARSYGHGIATIALCEAYGMTRDARLREPAQQAIRYILDAQDPRLGGWRYTKPDLAPVWYRESDTSVSGWMVMALMSAQMAGLTVPDAPLHKVAQWLDFAQAEGGARYVYHPQALLTPEQIRGRWPNRAMTAEGLLMRLYLGWQRDNPALVAGADYLRSNPPTLGTSDEPLRDSYYWYYATQVMFHLQGDHWATWNEHLQAILLPSQAIDGPWAGSWDPRSPQSDRWAHAGGRLYVTTLNLLTLEVYYRHLPLFQTLAK